MIEMAKESSVKQATETIDGVDFKFQHPGARWYLELTDRCKNRFGVMQQAKYTDEVLKNVVVEPADINSIDDFGPGGNYGMKTLNQLVEKIESFLNS